MAEKFDDAARGNVRLRAIRRGDLEWIAEMDSDPAKIGEHNWSGEDHSFGELLSSLTERYDGDGFDDPDRGLFVVELENSTRIGTVSWRTERWGPSRLSACPAFGIALLPEHRGRGYGTEAQRRLIDHLFSRSLDTHRVQSDTAGDNAAEQRSLEKAGMTREGVVREAEWRNGRYHDHILYSILRSEWESAQW
jgi:RimJ/RimL family protein N-acetyltransferase